MTPYYDDGSVTIYHGDCREVLPMLVAEAVITDPPYGVELKTKRARHGHGRRGFSVRPASYGFDDTPDYIAEVVVPVVKTCRELARSVAVTPGTRNLWLYPPADDVGCVFYAAGGGVGRWGFTCSQPILYYGSDPYLRTSQGCRPNSVTLKYANDANESGHPCAKPIRFVRWLVNRASLPGETVCDPFMGSGTTLEAAKYLNRRAIGIEIEERYCEIAAQRCAQEVLPLELSA